MDRKGAGDRSMTALATYVMAVATLAMAGFAAASVWNGYKAQQWNEAQLYEKHLLEWAGGWMEERRFEHALRGEGKRDTHDSTGDKVNLTMLSITLHGIAAEYDRNGKSYVAWGMRSHENDGNLVFWLRDRNHEGENMTVTVRPRPKPVWGLWQQREKAFVVIRQDRTIAWTARLVKISGQDLNPRSGGYIRGG